MGPWHILLSSTYSVLCLLTCTRQQPNGSNHTYISVWLLQLLAAARSNEHHYR